MTITLVGIVVLWIGLYFLLKGDEDTIHRKRYSVSQIPCFVCDMIMIDVDKWEDHCKTDEHRRNILNPDKIAAFSKELDKKRSALY